jgi:hypothetical protein
MVRASQPQKPPHRPPSRVARAQRCYLRREAHASGPDADARRSRETTLHRKRQAQVRARRSALPCPPTTDLGPDKIVRRDHELDLHRLRQTEYRACLRLHHGNRMSRLLPALKDTMQVDVPREPEPLQIPAFLHPSFVPIVTGGAAPCKLAAPASHTCLDRVRVRNIGDDMHKCTLCLECYHGMTLHDTLCAGCHNEVRSPFSLVCSLTDILMPKSAANSADPGEIWQNSTRSSTASLRWRRCSVASPPLAS